VDSGPFANRLITGNTRDMKRIRKAFAFEYASPFPVVA
jgi:hypothetical protein